VFVLYPIKTSPGWGPSSDKPFRLDSRAGTGGSGVQLPRDLPVGELALLAVPRELAEKSKEPLDPAWLKPAAPGVVRVEGTIHTYPVEKYSALHRYQVDRTAKGL